MRTVFTPARVQWDHVTTGFVKLSVTLDTTGVSDRLRAFCPLFMHSILETDVKMPNGTVVPFADIVNALLADTVSHSSSVGLGGSPISCGEFPQLLCLSLTVGY